MSEKKKIAVIGAGVSGLTAAYRLKKAGWDVTVWEARDRVGGCIATKIENSYLIDLGPNSTLETSPKISQLIVDLGLEDQKCYASDVSANRYILRDGILQPLPMSPVSFLKTKLFSTKAKLNLLKEPFVPPSDGTDISLADFVRRRLGQEFLDYAINPFVAGVYAGKPEKLSVLSAFPKLYALEQKYGSLIKGAIIGARERKKSKEVSKDRARLFSFRNGMSTLTDTLAEKLEGYIQLKRPVEAIHHVHEKFEVEVLYLGELKRCEYDRILITTPAETTVSLLSKFNWPELETIGGIEYAPVAVLFLGYDRNQIEHDLNGFGFLVPEKEHRKILGAIWNSSLFPGRAPDGEAGFTVFIGGSRQPELLQKTDDELLEIAASELSALMGISGMPKYTVLKRWPKAIPQYNIGYSRYQHLFADLESEIDGLHFSGNFLNGISVGDCIVSAEAAVKRITEKLS